ncbi:hypothetical protein QE382_001119 [Sphingobacterium zeae]|uniref:Uncharacterized protein n=1 Tax=Sphingobacterium zeae TaxID=1776859 RepID=A0ABU0U2E9_9SPHI|nr:hypothetical protein [Sphingobacterium zeae]
MSNWKLTDEEIIKNEIAELDSILLGIKSKVYQY